jgi:hypothetical protein
MYREQTPDSTDPTCHIRPRPIPSTQFARTRKGTMRVVASIAVVTASLLASSSSAFAATYTTFASGVASGSTVALGNSDFLIEGRITSASNPTTLVGTYRGTYHEITTGYTSCPLAGIRGEFACAQSPDIARCNLILGRIRLVFGNSSAEMPIDVQDVTTGAGFRASICLDSTDPAIHDVHIYGSDTRFDTSPFAPVTFNFPAWDDIYLALDGTSTPLGTGNVYADTLQFSLVLETL